MDAAPTIRKLDAWQVAIVLMAALPSIFVLATWDSDGLQTPQAFAVRYLSLPVALCELFIIYLAVRSRFDLPLMLRNVGSIPRMLMAIWALFAFLPLVLSNSTRSLSAFATFQYVLHGIFLAAAVHLAQNTHYNDNRRSCSLSVVAIGSCFYVVLLAIFSLLVPDKEAFPWDLRLPTGTNIRQIGYFVAIASVAPLSFVLFGQAKLAVFSVTFSIFVTFIAWSGSRGALVGLVSASALGAVFLGGSLSKLRVGIASLSFVAGLAISLAIPAPGPEFGLVRMVSSLEQEDIGSGRSFVWKSTISEISKAPWVGHGSGSFNKNMWEIYGFDFNHPHQFVLQYFYDWGAIGGGAGGLLLFLLFLTCLRHGRQHKDAAAYASITSLCTIATVGMIDGALFYPLSIFLAIVAIACGFVSRPAEKCIIPNKKL